MHPDLQVLDGTRFDIAIIGAGINGAIFSYELAAAGYSVLLVEKDDFASGATSRSGRILHCGLRFMAPNRSIGEYFRKPGTLLNKLRVARDMARCHGELYRTIPERLRPMTLALPVYRDAGYSGWHVDIGARLVRLFNGNRSPIGYTRSRGTTSLHPFVKNMRDKEEITSVVSFVDQQFYWPERVAVDAILRAEACGATVRNYTRLDSLARSAGGDWSLSLSDATGGSESVEVSARLVFNLAGAWIDEVNSSIRSNASPGQRVRGMKGIHLLVRLPPEYRGNGVVGEARDGQHLFCLPWGDLHYVGPTETVYEGNLDEVAPEEAEIDYVVDEVCNMLPGIGIRREDIILSWAGVRPITHNPDMPNGQRLPFGVFHDLGEDGLENLLAVTWGIIVTHRKAGRDALEAARVRLGPPVASRSARPTEWKPIDLPDFATAETEPEPDQIRLEDIAYFVKNEHAKGLVDILCRRTAMLWNGVLSPEVVRAAAERMAELQGWDAERISREIDEVAHFLRTRHRHVGF